VAHRLQVVSAGLDWAAAAKVAAPWVQAVRDNYDIPQRWYRLKAQVLGLDPEPASRPAKWWMNACSAIGPQRRCQPTPWG
jgi:hypothetical protein